MYSKTSVLFIWIGGIFIGLGAGLALTGADHYLRMCSLKERAYNDCVAVPGAKTEACLVLLKPD